MSAGSPAIRSATAPPGRGSGGCEHEDRLVTIGPRIEAEHGVVRVAPDDEAIHRGHERIVTVLLAAARRGAIERPFARAMNPSTLTPTKTDVFTRNSVTAQTAVRQ